MEDRFSVAGKTAVVTGASSGLGVAFAKGLAKAGANVVLAARRKENIDALAQRINAEGGTAFGQMCDVTQRDQVASLLDATCERYGRVDVMVNNAGVAAEAGMLPERVPADLFQQTVQTNLVGTWHGCQEAGVRMLKDGRGGSIINIASVMGILAQQNAPVAYQATKAAVINLTRNLAASWCDRGVRVNCIAPGWFATEMTAGWFAVPSFLARFVEQTPMGRIGEAEELVGPLLFLASDAASYVTGQAIAVDGGASSTIGGHYTEEHYAMLAQILGEYGQRIVPA